MAVSKVFIKGRIERGEFREPYRQCTEMLEQMGNACSVNPAIAEDSVDFVLFFQSYPLEFLPSDLAELRRYNPFAPFFFVLGTCCEGMLRTAGPLVSPFYCYAHAWEDTETEQIRRFLCGEPSLFSLPMTVENDEIALWQTTDGRRQTADSCREPDSSREPATVSPEETKPKCLILTNFGPFGNDSAMNLLIADEQRQQDFEPEFCRLPSAVSRLPIFADLDDSPREKILDSIQRIRAQFADNDFTVYVDSPRIDEKNAYLLAGVTRVLPKIR